jgi:rhodanese-related sulfurtransferase
MGSDLVTLSGNEHSIAADWLRAQGFSPPDRNAATARWLGHVDVSPHSHLPLEVELPAAFPYVLPKFFVARASLARRIPHVEESGKICLATSEALVLDVRRPTDILQEALARARHTLDAGLSGSNHDDFVAEFEPYWCDGREVVTSCYTPTGAAQPLLFMSGRIGRLPGLDQKGLIADTPAQLTTWGAAGKASAAFALPVSSPIVPPWHDEAWSFDDLLKTVAPSVYPADWDRFIAWYLEQKTTRHLVLEVRGAGSGADSALVGMRIGPLLSKTFRWAVERARTRRSENAELSLRLAGIPVVRQRIVRLDDRFRLPRGGASVSLRDRSVAIVGCGAIGGFLAMHLARAGVGRFELVDFDKFKLDNVHRHVLGMESVGSLKVDALARALRGHVGDVVVATHASRIELVMAQLVGVDLVVLATGDQTLERRMNELLRDHVGCLHTWLEPLGIGGHALLTESGAARGCFACLFHDSEEHGLVNSAALAAPGQKFQRSHYGCAGTFTPFSSLDADRTALMAAELAVEFLTGVTPPPLLSTWFGNPSTFKAHGFQVSSRAESMGEGRRVAVDNFSDPFCTVCALRIP